MTGTGTGTTGGSGTGTEVLPPVTTGPGNVGGTMIPGGTEGSVLPDNKGLEGYTPDRTAFQAYTVYFEFDLATVRGGELTKLDSVAKALTEMGNAKVQIEGHCDERGTEEYNRSLGERRALAIRELLVQKGVQADRVFTISYGEDKPAVAAHTDAAWSKNRRGEFILYTKKP
jgi:peptidoglycan-associated lipoprotein